jgi:hypothetical protein
MRPVSADRSEHMTQGVGSTGQRRSPRGGSLCDSPVNVRDHNLVRLLPQKDARRTRRHPRVRRRH